VIRKESRYLRIYNQLSELLRQTDDPVARMATIAAILHYKMSGFFWTGFYILRDGKLIVGPYQGPLACQQLEKNKGVCWTGIQKKMPVIVPDVSKFPGHIACDSRSQSELVVPVFNAAGSVMAVMDIDSKLLNHFDETDASQLERIVDLIYSS
jgi:L-methionine (R)-S-oxide reductase